MDQKEYIGKDGSLIPEVVEDLLVEIASGRHLFESCGDLFAIRPPTLLEQDRARIIYSKRVRHLKKQGLLTRKELEKICYENDILSKNNSETKKSLDGLIDRNVKARDMTTDKNQKLGLSKEIESLIKQINKITEEEEAALCHSVEVRADYYRSLYYISCCTMTGEMLDESYWESWKAFLSDRDSQIVEDATTAYQRMNSGMPIPIIRAIARNPEWRFRWKSSKESGSQIFEGASSGWTKNQLSLVYWSDFYDSVYNHPECPKESIISDDQALQDWINGQVSKSKKSAGQTPRRPAQSRKDNYGRTVVPVEQKTYNVNAPYKIRA